MYISLLAFMGFMLLLLGLFDIAMVFLQSKSEPGNKDADKR